MIAFHTLSLLLLLYSFFVLIFIFILALALIFILFCTYFVCAGLDMDKNQPYCNEGSGLTVMRLISSGVSGPSAPRSLCPTAQFCLDPGFNSGAEETAIASTYHKFEREMSDRFLSVFRGRLKWLNRTSRAMIESPELWTTTLTW